MRRVRNVHRREYSAAADAVGALIDTLASPNDRLWPLGHWPAMRFDRPLGEGASGGHGPIGYVVESYEPGRRIRFRFFAPRGFDGFHEFRAMRENGAACLVHELDMTARGFARMSWPLVFRPLHDALVEDAFDKAAIELHEQPLSRPWSRRVRTLRTLLRFARKLRER